MGSQVSFNNIFDRKISLTKEGSIQSSKRLTYDSSLKWKTVETSFKIFLDLDQLGQVLLQVDACILEYECHEITLSLIKGFPETYFKPKLLTKMS